MRNWFLLFVSRHLFLSARGAPSETWPGYYHSSRVAGLDEELRTEFGVLADALPRLLPKDIWDYEVVRL